MLTAATNAFVAGVAIIHLKELVFGKVETIHFVYPFGKLQCPNISNFECPQDFINERNTATGQTMFWKLTGTVDLTDILTTFQGEKCQAIVNNFQGVDLSDSILKHPS